MFQPPDEEKRAFSCDMQRLKKLAEQGDVAAQYSLGVCYQQGAGVAKNEREAVRFFRLAAEQGDADAQYGLGMCYHRGTGVAKDKREAIRFFQLAADQGDAGARKP
jgi:uncharacterized protein